MPDPANPVTPSTPDGSTAPTGPALPEGIVARDGQFFVASKVNGEVREVPFSEALIRLQKDVSVDQGFQANAQARKELEDLRKQNENAIKYYELSQRAVKNNDPDAGRQALLLLGIEPEDEDPVTPSSPSNPQPVSDPDAAKYKAFVNAAEELGVDPADLLRDYRAKEAEKIRTRVYGELDSAVSTDKQLAAIMKGGGPKAERLKKSLQRVVGEKIREGLPPGASTYSTVIQEVRQELTDWGTLGDANQPPNPPVPGFPGLGPNTSGMGLVEALRPDSPPKPVSPITKGTEAYGKNLVERWAFGMHEG